MVYSGMSETIARTPPVAEPSAAGAPPGRATDGTDADPEVGSDPRRRTVRAHSAALTGLFVLAAIYTIHYAKPVLMPVAAAVVLYILLWPAVRLLQGVRVPTPLGAAIVVAGLLGVGATGIYILADPASAWLAQAPQVISDVQAKLEAPVSELTKAKEKIESLVEGRAQRAGSADEDGPRVGVVNAALYVVATVQQVGVTLLIITALLFLLLASGTMFQEKLVRSLPRFSHKKQAVAITNQIQKDIFAYLGTVAVINTGLVLAIGLALYAIGMPNAALWGTMAALLNFVPYIGFAIGASVVFIVGLLTFDSFAAALLPPMIYILCNAIEANAITPILLSRRLTLNAVVVFLAVLAWGWLWGVAGALLAVPLLAMIKIIADHIDGFRGVSEFLGGREPPPV